MKRVLVVDDDSDLLAIVRSYLVRRGYEVYTCCSCTEGIAALDNFKPDFVLLDVNVGAEDGREMCRTITQQANWNHIPVVMISANHEQLSTVQSYGAKAALQKPFEMERVLSMISGK